MTDYEAPPPRLPRLGVDLHAIRARYQAITTTHTRKDFHAALLASVLDVPYLVSEVDILWERLVRTRRRYADLLAAGRATLAAASESDPDPLWYLRDEITTLPREWWT